MSRKLGAIQTSKSMRVDMPPGLAIQDCQYWHTITQAMQTRLFHVRFQDKKTEFEKVVWTSDQVVLEGFYTGIKHRVLEVNLFSPPGLNGGIAWQFDSLDRVVSLLRIIGKSEVLVGYEYQLSTGVIFYEQFDGRYERTDSSLVRHDFVLSKEQVTSAEIST